MKRPVHHVIGREDDERLDSPIVVFTLFPVCDELLMVVCPIHIEPSVVHESCRVGTEHTRTDRIAIACILITCRKVLGGYLKTKGCQYSK